LFRFGGCYNFIVTKFCISMGSALDFINLPSLHFMFSALCSEGS
jgi:hypothetical protein